MTRIHALASLAIVATLSLAGCAAPAPEPTGTPTPTPTSTPIASTMVTVYWAESTDTAIQLAGETQTIPETEAEPVALVTALVAGDIEPLDAKYTNLWGNGSSVNSVTIKGKLATVDLHLAPLNVGGEAEGVAIDQIVWTLTEVDPSVKRVQLTVDGKVVESLAGHVDATQPFTR